VTEASAGNLMAIDDALLRLRRLWAASKHRILDDGVTGVELSSLLVVEACARCREQGREANVSDVANLADVAPSTASRLVDAAEDAGLLDRQPSSASGRHTALVLTAAGDALRARAVVARTGWLADQLRDWDAEDVNQFGRLLQRFADRVGPSRPVQ
jgi:DNA-binding MarR family transcriptional regulator